MPKPKLYYALVGFDLTRPPAIIHKGTSNLAALHKILDQAIKDGARIISIRVIHAIPEPKGES